MSNFFRYIFCQSVPPICENRHCVYFTVTKINILYQSLLKLRVDESNEVIFGGLPNVWPVFVSKIWLITFCSYSQLWLYCLPVNTERRLEKLTVVLSFGFKNVWETLQSFQLGFDDQFWHEFHLATDTSQIQDFEKFLRKCVHNKAPQVPVI
jgi:hypothetical protein